MKLIMRVSLFLTDKIELLKAITADSVCSRLISPLITDYNEAFGL